MSLAFLRHETGPMHKALEEKLRLFETVRSKEEYAQHLERVFRWLCPLEAELKAPATELLADWPEREKSALLAADLQALGASLPAILPPSPLSCTSPAHCLGILYVLEGSSLGGQVISRHYGEKLGLTPHHGLRFFSGYGEQTGPKWRAFLARLEGFFLAQPAQVSDLVEGARAAFHSYSESIPRQHE